MLLYLWYFSSEDFFDASRIVEAFEILTVRHPQLTIPFDKILVVGQAYRKLGEFERAWLVFRATIDSSFLIDSNVSAVLEDEGQLLSSVDYQESLWWDYPDTADVEASSFALSQMLYEHATKIDQLGDETRRIHIDVPRRTRRADEKPTRSRMLADAIRLLDSFMTLYPASPLSDDAAFSMANAYLDLEDYDTWAS